MTGDTTPADWYADPSDSTRLRYWDGSQWTGHTAPVTTGPTSTGSTIAPAGKVGLPPPPAADPGFPEPPEKARGGLLGSKKALEAELENLRALIAGFGYGEREALAAEIARLRGEQSQLAGDLAARRTELSGLQSQLVMAREEQILQEVGVYDYNHRLEDSAAYKDRLDALRQQIKAMSKKDGGAVLATTNWTVEGSAAKGRKMVNDISKLLLRAYNGEADVLVGKLRPYKLEAAIDRLAKSKQTITRLGSTMSITINEQFHRARIEELRLTADFLAKKEEEKEAEREEKARLREEARARKEFEAEKARLLKEQAHYSSALESLRATGSPEEVAAAEARLVELDEAITGVEDRAANIRAGYVYVISNFGAFGPEMVKIGMTRRLEPMDRVRELGDASVPFRFDVHALVFSDDAVSLESRLHDAFAAQRVNLVNLRREFFYATPAQVKAVLSRQDGSLLEFVEEPVAEEWHLSANAREQLV